MLTSGFFLRGSTYFPRPKGEICIRLFEINREADHRVTIHVDREPKGRSSPSLPSTNFRYYRPMRGKYVIVY